MKDSSAKETNPNNRHQSCDVRTYMFLFIALLLLFYGFSGQNFANLFPEKLSLATLTSLDRFITFRFELPGPYEKPVVFVELTLHDLTENRSYRKWYLSTGLDIETEFMEPGSISDDLFNLRKLEGLNYTARISLPRSECSVNSTKLKLSLFARLEYNGIDTAMIDYAAKHHSFTGFSSPLVTKNITFCVDTFNPGRHLSRWFVSEGITWEYLDFDLNYAYYKSPAKGIDVSKCKDEPFFSSNISVPEGAKKVKKNLFFIGDSQINFECSQVMSHICSNAKPCGENELICLNPGGNCIVKAKDTFVEVNFFCIKKRKAITMNIKKYRDEFTSFMRSAESYWTNYSKDDTILFWNPSGLWEAGEGQIMKDKGQKLTSVMPSIMDILFSTSIGFSKKFFVTTTRVDPSIYKKLLQDKWKISLTQPRVEYVNNLWLDAVRRSKYGLEVVDSSFLSRVGLGESLNPFDMRHLGYVTNWKVMRFQFCHALNDLL